ncbi:MAG: glycosyltransferase family 4 protein [Cupriavidus necator]
MKLLLTNAHVGWAGGHTTYIRELAKALAARHQVFVACPSTSDVYKQSREIPGVEVVAMDFPSKPKNLLHILRVRGQLRDLIRRECFDIVHVNGSPDHRMMMYAMAGLGEPKPKVVYTRHASTAVGKGFSSLLRARIATDHVIAVSHHTARAMSATPYGTCGVTTVHNGVDVTHFFPYDQAATQAVRRQLLGDANRSKLIVGTVTGFTGYKGTMDLVEAVASLPARDRAAIHILVAGEPPDAPKLARIHELEMEAAITALGVVSHVRPAIAALDVGFVLSHAVETISFACREMMAMAKPVMVTNYAGLPENIAPHVDGWIVQPRSPLQIADCLQEILNHREALQEMGAAARRRSELSFDLERFVAGTESVYQRVAAGGE